MLAATDLADVLKWSQSISSDINLTSCEFSRLLLLKVYLTVKIALQRLTEIATGEPPELIFLSKTNLVPRVFTSPRCIIRHADGRGRI